MLKFSRQKKARSVKLQAWFSVPFFLIYALAGLIYYNQASIIWEHHYFVFVKYFLYAIGSVLIFGKCILVFYVIFHSLTKIFCCMLVNPPSLIRFREYRRGFQTPHERKFMPATLGRSGYLATDTAQTQWLCRAALPSAGASGFALDAQSTA